MVNSNGNSPVSFIQSLVTPSVGGATRRMSWGVDVEAVWVPFFTATNAVGDTNVSHDALGAPIRLSVDKAGEPRFGANGRPSMRVAPEMTQQIRTVRENFVASLQAFTGETMDEHAEAYENQVKLSQDAGAILVEQDAQVLIAHEAREAALLAAAEPCLEDIEAATEAAWADAEGFPEAAAQEPAAPTGRKRTPKATAEATPEATPEAVSA